MTAVSADTLSELSDQKETLQQQQQELEPEPQPFCPGLLSCPQQPLGPEPLFCPGFEPDPPGRRRSGGVEGSRFIISSISSG